MAKLPDPSETLTGEDRVAFDRMASVRSHAEGRASLGEVYVAMFNNPALATKVGALGEHLRFEGVLPDDVRELAIVRFAARQGFWYEWSHHQRPARLAGIPAEVIEVLSSGAVPGELSDSSKAVIDAVDAIVEKRTIPTSVQRSIVEAHGEAGVVEVVGLCGLYAMMGYMVTAFDIGIEDGLPEPPVSRSPKGAAR